MEPHTFSLPFTFFPILASSSLCKMTPMMKRSSSLLLVLPVKDLTTRHTHNNACHHLRHAAKSGSALNWDPGILCLPLSFSALAFSSSRHVTRLQGRGPLALFFFCCSVRLSFLHRIKLILLE
ncbi:hypothetical protein QBC35DRAFT_490675 [Podospora australis]|uniref:Uncharacterized protein n=1 Tax=Podospora australis TaxID=1536484 RepID=A0AAN7AIV6_9PEZI|nr:hypothetical protein QBC35DRAFT_490675 [Podospora australis]